MIRVFIHFLWESTNLTPKQESASLLTSRMTAPLVTPGLVLALEDYMMTPILVETRQSTSLIMETNTSKPWDISWYNREDYSQIKHSSLTHLVPAPLISRFTYALSALALYLPFCYKSPADSWNLISRC